MSGVSLTPLANITRLSPRVLRVLAQNPGVATLQGTNTYIVGTGENRVLIDTGSTGPDIKQYHSLLREVLGNTRISHILITHWHGDHTGGVNGILMNMMESLTSDIEIMKLPCAADEESNLEFTNSYSRFLNDREKISVEGATLEVLHTPGHASDHASFFLHEENSIFSGDCILGETSCIVEDLKQYMNSLALYEKFNPVSTIYPGHGPVVEKGSEKISEYIKHRMQRENQILQCLSLSNNVTEDELLSKVYPGLDEKYQPLALNNIRQHLKKLMAEAKVEKLLSGEYKLSPGSNL